MLGLEPVAGLRVVADPSALDRAAWHGEEPLLVLRFAPDEAFAMGAERVDLDDPHAIVELEPGFVVLQLGQDDLSRVLSHIDWPLPTERPALAQGNVAGVPAKLWLDERQSLLLTLAAYADELAGRLR